MSLTEEKILEAKNELKEWINKSDSKEFYYDQATEKINSKFNEHRIPKSILVSYTSLLNTWFGNNFVYEMLEKGNSIYQSKLAGNGYQALLLADKFSDIYPNNPPHILFDKTLYWLANCLSQKWYAESKQLIEIINKGLSTGLLEGGWDIKTSSWFILKIANLGFSINTDLSKFNYPNDMGIYSEAIKNWNTTDINILDSNITALCDYHLKNARYGEEETTPDIQFGDSAWFVYAFEILAWLSIREKTGLKNPKSFSHPLMSLAINKLPEVIVPMPKDELFDRVMLKITEEK